MEQQPVNKFSTKTTLIIIGVVFVIVFIVGIVIYRSGKKTGKEEGTVNVSSPVDDTPGLTTTSGISTAELRSLAQGLYTDMNGINYSHDTSQWQRVLNMSDSDLVRLNNEFNNDYQVTSGQTFKTWVDNEEAGFLSPVWGTMKQTVLDRLAKLKIV